MTCHIQHVTSGLQKMPGNSQELWYFLAKTESFQNSNRKQISLLWIKCKCSNNEI